jgi:hypothetical protein
MKLKSAMLSLRKGSGKGLISGSVFSGRHYLFFLYKGEGEYFSSIWF